MEPNIKRYDIVVNYETDIWEQVRVLHLRRAYDFDYCVISDNSTGGKAVSMEAVVISFPDVVYDVIWYLRSLNFRHATFKELLGFYASTRGRGCYHAYGTRGVLTLPPPQDFPSDAYPTILTHAGGVVSLFLTGLCDDGWFGTESSILCFDEK